MSEKQNDVKSSRAIQFLESLERPRPQQIKLAKASERATELGLNLIAEGPCGVGKSWAYLIPALLNKTQVVVVTATIALQDQIIKDIKNRLMPMLELGNLHVIKAKGMSNYMCLLKSKRFTPVHGNKVEQKLKEWCETTQTGDKSELVNIRSRDWKKVSTTIDECMGKQCKFEKQCMATGAFAGAIEGTYDVLVLNYHMFLIALKFNVFKMPDTVILDEAHRLEDITRTVIGYEIRPGSFKCIDKRIEKESKGAIDLGLEDLSSILYYRLAESAYENEKMYKSITTALWEEKELVNNLEIAADVLCEKDKKGNKKKDDKVVMNLRNNLVDFMSCGSSKSYYYLQDINKRAIPVSRLFDVSEFLAKRLFVDGRSVQLFSATMPYNIADALGMPVDNRARVSSETPFDTSRVKIYIGNQKYDYEKEHEYIEYIVDLSTRCIKALGGRTLGLFASANRMRVARLEVQERVGDEYEILNTEDDKDAAARRFKEDPRVVLFGLKTFWEGFDAPGKTCCCVIIEKIPYESPTTPLATAGMDRLGKSEYAKKIMRPAAVTAIKQAIGRLQRVESDYGLVVIADPRARSMLNELGLSSRDLVKSLEEGIQHVMKLDSAFA